MIWIWRLFCSAVISYGLIMLGANLGANGRLTWIIAPAIITPVMFACLFLTYMERFNRGRKTGK
jgi:hypothetical protein